MTKTKLSISLFAFVFMVFVTAISFAGSDNNTSSVAPGYTLDISGNNPVVYSQMAPLPNCGWSSKTPMTPMWAGASTFYSRGVSPNDTGWIYYIAGNNASFLTVSVVNRLNLRTNVWDVVAPLPELKSQISAVTVRGKIYVIGGYGSSSFVPVNTNNIYDPVTNTWTTGAPLPIAVGDQAVCSYNDSLIYIVGGYDGSGDLNTVQIYNVVSNTWSTGTPKPGAPVGGVRAGIYGNKLVVVGGYSQVLATPVDSSYVGTIGVNTNTITWSANIPYPGGKTGRHAAGSVYKNNPNSPYVLFTGGDPNGAGTQTINATYGFNVNTMAWDLGPVKTTGVSNVNNFVGITRNDTLYMVCLGGYNGSAVVGVNEWLCLGTGVISGTSNNGGLTPTS